MQSDIVKLLTQFQSYSLKQAEFLGEMVSNKEWAGLIRYGLASTAMVATVGRLIGMKPTDIIPSFRTGLPPTLQAPVEIGKALLGTQDKYGNIPDTKERLQNVGKSLLPFVPAGTQIKKTVGGLGDVLRGYSQSASGRVRYGVENNPIQLLRGGLFGPNNLPEAQRYRKEGLQVLGEKQSKFVKESDDLMGTYKFIRDAQKADKKPTESSKKKSELQQKTDQTTLDQLKGQSPEFISNFLREKAKTDPGLVTRLKERVKSPEQQTIESLPVKDGTRARFVLDKMGSLQDTEQKTDFLKNLVEKGAITRETLQQATDIKMARQIWTELQRYPDSESRARYLQDMANQGQLN